MSRIHDGSVLCEYTIEGTPEVFRAVAVLSGEPGDEPGEEVGYVVQCSRDDGTTWEDMDEVQRSDASSLREDADADTRWERDHQQGEYGDLLPCGCRAHRVSVTGWLGFFCHTESQPYCNFECDHEAGRRVEGGGGL